MSWAEDLYLILVNIRVCSYDDSLLHSSLRRSAFHNLVEGRKIKTVRQIKWNEMFYTKSRVALLTFEMWVVVVVTVVPLLVSEVTVWDTDVPSLSSGTSSVTWEKDRKKKKEEWITILFYIGIVSSVLPHADCGAPGLFSPDLLPLQNWYLPCMQTDCL